MFQGLGPGIFEGHFHSVYFPKLFNTNYFLLNIHLSSNALQAYLSQMQ